MKTPYIWMSLALVPALSGNIMTNPGFDQGTNNLAGYEAFAAWSQGAVNFSSAYGLADAPVVAPGNGTAVFGMNTQLAAADSFWVGGTQSMSFLQSFWSPDNGEGVSPTTDLYGQTITFSGNLVISEAYAPGNTAEAYILFLDPSYFDVGGVTLNVTTLASGSFSIEATVPSSGLNIVQVGFRNIGIEGTAGEMTVSGLSVTAVPEPTTTALLGGLVVLGVVLMRRRKN